MINKIQYFSRVSNFDNVSELPNSFRVYVQCRTAVRSDDNSIYCFENNGTMVHVYANTVLDFSVYQSMTSMELKNKVNELLEDSGLQMKFAFLQRI